MSFRTDACFRTDSFRTGAALQCVLRRGPLPPLLLAAARVCCMTAAEASAAGGDAAAALAGPLSTANESAALGCVCAEHRFALSSVATDVSRSRLPPGM
jgi:hypothetical protein